LWKALGATPTPTATSEIYTNLQTHVMDGVTASLSSIEPLKLQEVVKYVSLTNHIWSGYTFLANADAWQKLPKPLRDIAEKNFEAARLASNDDFAKNDGTVNDRLKSLGLAINNCDIPAFRRTVRDAGLYAQWKTLYGADAWALLEKSVGRSV
jgi:TRAP-type C4-dicarboxylate transport system substrate-binding protein